MQGSTEREGARVYAQGRSGEGRASLPDPLLEGKPEMFQPGNGSGVGECEDFP